MLGSRFGPLWGVEGQEFMQGERISVAQQSPPFARPDHLSALAMASICCFRL